jgi:hypothetical protein
VDAHGLGPHDGDLGGRAVAGQPQGALPAEQRRAQQPRLGVRAGPLPVLAGPLDEQRQALLLAAEDAQLAVEQVQPAPGGLQPSAQPQPARPSGREPQRPTGSAHWRSS